MKRYDLNVPNEPPRPMVEHPSGAFVLHTDHAAAVSRLRAEVDKVSADFDAVADQRDGALANLERMTERHARLLEALVALEPCHQLPSYYILAVVHKALAADDDSGGEG